MADAMRPLNPDTLLAERPWVEALARRLVHDEATARDVVQETWLAAIESPPANEGALRGWLSRVVRNAAFASRRAAGRRTRHEALAAPRASIPSPEDTIAAAEAHRRLVDAVMSLDEPYRTAILLRFFEGLESDQVAERTGVPVETARTRVKRALALLRGRLDREHGGDGRSWALALLPLAGARRGLLPAAAVTTGGVVMASVKTIVAAALVGALAATLITRQVMGPDEGTKDVANAPSESRPRADGNVPPRGSQDETATPLAPRPAAVQDPWRSALSSAMDAVEVEIPRPGTGTITGRVLSKDGAGVAGVTIRAFAPRTGYRHPKPAGREPFTVAENATHEAIWQAKWHAATTREATSDASGAYTLTELFDAAYSLSASSPAYSVRLAPGAERTSKPGATVDFVATGVVQVPIAIVTSDGVALEQVLVRWKGPRGGGSSAWWTPAEPFVRVEPGEWEFTAEVDQSERSQPVTVTVQMGGPVQPVTLELAARNRVSGVLHFDAADAGWDSASVALRRKGAAATEEPKSVGARAPDWSFRFDDVEPGEYDLTAGLTSNIPLVSTVVRMTSGAVTQDLTLPRLGADHFVTLRVLGPDGAPLPEGDLQLGLIERMERGGIAAMTGSKTARQPDGSLKVYVKVRPTEPVPPSRWSLEARSKLYGKAEVQFEKGQPETLEIRFAAPAIFKPAITGIEGTEFASRVSASLAPAGNLGATEYSYSHQRIETRVPPGSYQALLWLANAQGSRARLISRTPVRLVAGVNEVTLRMPELSTLTLRCPGVAQGTRVFLSGARRPAADLLLSESAQVAADGSVSFSELAPDLYFVQTTLDGEMRDMIVRVAGRTDVTFAATTISGLAVTVDDPAGALAAAGFQSGDLIVGVDGTAFDTMQRAETLIRGALGRESMTFDVVRGASRTTLTAKPSNFETNTARGGWWEPVVR